MAADSNAAEAPTSGSSVRIVDVGLVLAAIAALGQVVGLRPIALTAIVLMIWVAVLAPRLGPFMAVAVTVVGWYGVVAVTFTFGPATPLDVRVLHSAVLFASLLLARRIARQVSPQPLPRHAWLAMGASALGPLLWIAGLVIGTVRPGGGGLAWAMYRDSTMDVWETRRMLDYNGMGTVTYQFNYAPLSHAAGATLYPPGLTTGASPRVASAFLWAHADHWSIALCSLSLMAGLLVWKFSSTALRGTRGSVAGVVAAGIVSLGLLTEPIAGVAMDLGQINAPMVTVFLLAASTVIVAERAELGAAWGVAALAAALLSATWLPVLPIAGLLTVFGLVRLISCGGPRDVIAAWGMPGVVLGVFFGTLFVWPSVHALIARPSTTAATSASTKTHANPGFWESYTSPVSWLITVALWAALLALAVAVARRELTLSLGVAAVFFGVALVVVAWSWALGWDVSELPYYPAKHLWITNTMIAVLVVGLALKSLGLGLRLVPAGVTTLVVVAVAVSGLPAGVTLRLTPADVIMGDHFGTHDDTAGRFIDYAASDVLRVPWRLDPDHDATVNLMLSSVAPEGAIAHVARHRGVLRDERGEFTVEVACMLVRAEPRPVEFVTADPGLGPEIEAECPEDGWTVVVERVTD